MIHAMEIAIDHVPYKLHNTILNCRLIATQAYGLLYLINPLGTSIVHVPPNMTLCERPPSYMYIIVCKKYAKSCNSTAIEAMGLEQRPLYPSLVGDSSDIQGQYILKSYASEKLQSI